MKTPEEFKRDVLECAQKLYTDYEYNELVGVYPTPVLNFAAELVDLIDNDYPHFSLNHAFNFILEIDTSSY